MLSPQTFISVALFPCLTALAQTFTAVLKPSPYPLSEIPQAMLTCHSLQISFLSLILIAKTLKALLVMTSPYCVPETLRPVLGSPSYFIIFSYSRTFYILLS
jgi:hypothetical protein